MRRSGGTIVFADDPAAFVSTWRSETPVGFLQQRRRWASNACLQFRLNPGFFLYLSAVFLLSVLIPLGLIDPQLRDVAALAWAARATMDLAVLTAGALRFDRHDLLVMFPLWELLQIPYLLLVGVFGTVAGFTWKGTRYPVGQSALAGPAS
jgi:NADH:ubiquinone oxidoreductase subunit 4 (subunit M)